MCPVTSDFKVTMKRRKITDDEIMDASFAFTAKSLSNIGREIVQIGNRFLADCYTLSWQLRVMGHSANRMCKKCRQKEEHFSHTFCHCPVLTTRRMKVFCSV
jgi:hypothetical protein